MSDSVTSTATTPDPTFGSNTAVASPSTPAAAPEPQPKQPGPADLRLVIEDDREAGCFVYKTVDWRTGAVVQQLPGEQVIKLREAAHYVAGDVIDSSA